MISESITRNLTSFWLGTLKYNLQMLERYYYAQQSMSESGLYTTEQINDTEYNRFFKPVNYSAAIVEEPIGYLANGKIQIKHDNPKIQAWAESFFNRRIRPRMDDLVRWQSLFGEAHAYLWTDKEGLSRGLKMDVIPLVENGVQRVVAAYGTLDSEEITAATIYKIQATDKPNEFMEYRITLEKNQITIDERKQTTPRDSLGGWIPIASMKNPANVIPLVPFYNPTPSDILNFLSIQEDLDKLHVDIRFAREYHGWPMIGTDATTADGLKIGPRRIMYGGKFERLDPPSVDPLFRERDELLASGSKVCASLALLNDFKGDLSGVALEHIKQAFTNRLQSKANRFEQGLENLLSVAARIISFDVELYKYETAKLADGDKPSLNDLKDVSFDVVLEPNIPVNEKGNAEVADIWYNKLGVSQETAFAKAGVDNPTAEVEKAASEQATAMQPTPIPNGALNDQRTTP